MAWVAVDKSGEEHIFEYFPERSDPFWVCSNEEWVGIPNGVIAKLIGRELTWEDEPVELVEDKPQKVEHNFKEDEWIKVPKRTYDKMIDMFCDAHEANLKKACEILEGAILVGIERNLAECKAKDERIAELEAKLKDKGI